MCLFLPFGNDEISVSIFIWLKIRAKKMFCPFLCAPKALKMMHLLNKANFF